MTWVLGWPFYDEDAMELAKKHNLVKDPNAEDWRYVRAGRAWFEDRAGLLEVLSCMVDDLPELVIAAYVEYVDSPTPPNEWDLDRDVLMSKKQYRRLQKLLPLGDFGWFQHIDGSCTLYKEIVYVDVDDDEEEPDEHEGGAENEGEVVDDDGASDWEDEDEGSDAETVMAGATNRSSA